jgi:aryl-alcohol dehydrogenase-like predicted oxidoreductase
MIDRRTVLGGLASIPLMVSSACTRQNEAPAQPDNVGSATETALIQRPIPSADEQVPVIGVGTARRYENPVTEAELAPLRDTLATFARLGGEMIDTAPSYGRAEEVVGRLVEELDIRDQLFLATKVGVDSKEQGLAQIEQSFRNLRTDHIDLIAVHNLRDTDNQLATLRDLKAAGRIRSLGVTTSSDRQYEELEAVMRREDLDVIQVDYAIDNRNAAKRILPLAEEQGVAVMINLPFGRGRLFEATENRPLPDWAAEIDAGSWAQIFLKYIVSHPSRPIAIPGMSKVDYVTDNMDAARGRLPDAALRQRMENFIDAL